MVEVSQRRIAVTEEDSSEYKREHRDAANYPLLEPHETTMLIINAKKGCPKSAETLFLHYKKLVVAIGRKKLGPGYENFSDYCQDCFVEMFKSIDGLRKDKAFGSWLAKIARIVAIRHLKDRIHRLTLQGEPAGSSYNEEGEEITREEIAYEIGDTTQQSIEEQETNKHIRESFTELQQFLELQKSQNDPEVIKLFELKYRYISDGKNPKDHKFKTIAMHELNVNDDELRNVNDRLTRAIKQWSGYENVLTLLQVRVRR